jgi:hypothetical protein
VLLLLESNPLAAAQMLLAHQTHKGNRLLDLPVQSVAPEEGVVLCELQSLGGVLAVLRREMDIERLVTIK